MRTPMILASACLFAACEPVITETAQAPKAAMQTPVSQTSTLPSPPRYMWPAGQDHFRTRIVEIERQTPLKGGVLFVGDSITEGGDWQALFPNIDSRNHGVSWDTATGVISRIPMMRKHDPEQIFLLIGTNDLSYAERSPELIADEIGSAVSQLRAAFPDADIFVQSVMPREAAMMARVNALNAQLRVLPALRTAGVQWIDLTRALAAPDGTLKATLTEDRLHLNEQGYRVWGDHLSGYVSR